MRCTKLFRFLTAGLTASALWVAPGAAEPPAPPPFYAISNVTVVTGPGRAIVGGTVLIADGLIEAVGTGVDVPADAWTIDGEGLMLYPGLIDGLTGLGLKSEDDDDDGGGGSPFARGGPEIRGPEDRPKTTPWLSAADQLEDDGRFEKWRDAGFTAAVTAPADGLFTGQATLVHTGDSEPRQRVLATPVAQRLGLRGGGFRSYPGSLMGVIAYIGQVLSDAEHYATVKALYRRSPAGRERPSYDRTLDPIEEAVSGGLPFLIPAVTGPDIDRALRLASTYGLEPVVFGAHAGYARVERLKSGGAAALINLDWPEAEKDRDPDAETPFRTLYHRRLAPTTPQVLAEAGVPYAFYSGDLGSPSQIFDKLRVAIDAGLSSEAALAGLTTGPAEIFGVADRLGTIEVGKIANLVLVTAEPWAEDAEVRAVFVDGRKYEERQSDEPTEEPASDVSGTWEMTLTTPRGPQPMTADLEMAEDGKVSGEITSERGTSDVEEGRMSGDLLRFKITREMGGRSMQASYSLTVEGESLAGTLSAGPMTMDVSGERTKKPDEAGADEGDDEEADEVTIAELEEVMATYQGPVESLDRFAISNVTIYTLTGETIDNGTVVVEDGKIAVVGRAVRLPQGVPVVNGAGGSLIPGIIDAHAHVAVEGSVNEGSLVVTSMVSIGDVVDPDDIAIYRALAGGVTSANLLHGSANPIGGRNQVIKMRWGADAEGMKFEGAPAGIKFALGENPKRSNFRGFGIPQRYPQTRMGVMDVIRQAFTEAVEYRQAWAEYETAMGGAAKGGRSQPTPPRRDFKLEALVEILAGERLVHSHCYRADEILQLLRLAEEFGFKIATLQHVLEGYKVADEIAAHGAGASTFSDWWGYKVEAYDAIPHNAALMSERGVVVSINSDSGEEMRHLNQEAAKAVKWGGMDKIEALKLVTLNPAIQLGIDDRVGSIEVGKDADLVLYDGDPLAVGSVVQKTWVDGTLYFDRQADRARQAVVEEIKTRLGPPEEDEESDEETDEEAEASTAPPDPGSGWSDLVEYSCREEWR